MSRHHINHTLLTAATIVKILPEKLAINYQKLSPVRERKCSGGCGLWLLLKAVCAVSLFAWAEDISGRSHGGVSAE